MLAFILTIITAYHFFRSLCEIGGYCFGPRYFFFHNDTRHRVCQLGIISWDWIALSRGLMYMLLIFTGGLFAQKQNSQIKILKPKLFHNEGKNVYPPSVKVWQLCQENLGFHICFRLRPLPLTQNGYPSHCWNKPCRKLVSMFPLQIIRF